MSFSKEARQIAKDRGWPLIEVTLVDDVKANLNGVFPPEVGRLLTSVVYGVMVPTSVSPASYPRKKNPRPKTTLAKLTVRARKELLDFGANLAYARLPEKMRSLTQAELKKHRLVAVVRVLGVDLVLLTDYGREVQLLANQQ